MGLSSAVSKSIWEIAAELRRYCRGESSPRGIARLVDLAVAIVQQRLWGRLQAAARGQGTSAKQQAKSIVAGLFHKESPKSRLYAALEEILEADDTALYLRFQAVVTKAASQELFHRWKETNPAAARLWRTVQRAVRHDPRLVVFPCDAPEWVALIDMPEEAGNLQSIDRAQALHFLHEGGTAATRVPDTIVSLLRCAAESTKNRPVIRIDILFSALRETVRELAQVDWVVSNLESDYDPIIRMAVEKATAAVTENVRSRLAKYRDNGKLDPAIISCFKKAFDDLIADFSDGGPAQSHFQYLCAHSPQLTVDIYRKMYRTRFEYLAEMAEKNFIEIMRKELSG